MIRSPVVAGQFYSDSKDALEREVRSLLPPHSQKENAIGVVSPHAGYMYSGHVAGCVLSAINAKKIYVILGPNHTGLGAAIGIDDSDSWKTPLGEIEVERTLAKEIAARSEYVKRDNLSHSHEHSIEVQIPFLQVLVRDFKIVPLVISYLDLGIYREVGKAIAAAIKDLGIEKDVAIIASSDMTHYESQENAKKKDSAAIEAILELDEEMLVKKVAELDISMCGYAPTAIMLVAAKELGAKCGKLMKYQTSGDASGDYSSVVGYAGIIIN